MPTLRVTTYSITFIKWVVVPLITELGRQRQVDLCEFETSLVYRARSRTARAVTQRNPVSKTITTKKKKNTTQMSGTHKAFKSKL